MRDLTLDVLRLLLELFDELPVGCELACQATSVAVERSAGMKHTGQLADQGPYPRYFVVHVDNASAISLLLHQNHHSG